MFYSVDTDYFKTTNFKPIFIMCVIQYFFKIYSEPFVAEAAVPFLP